MPGTYHTTTVQEYLEWPPANYTNPETRTWLAPYSIVLLVVGTLCTFGRLWIRSRNRWPPWDDYFLFLAWIFSVAFTVEACVAVWDLEIGRHAWDIEIDKWTYALRNGWLAQVFFTHSAAAAKVAILGFYIRIFRGTTKKRWLYTVWAMMFITVGSWIGIFASYLAMCQPLVQAWTWPQYTLTNRIDELHCVDGSALIIAIGVLTIASDFWCAALPFFYSQYHDLGATRRQKIAMNVIFLSGFAVTGVGAARTYYLWELAHRTDASWIGFDLYAVSVAECQLGIICCCLPFLRVFFRRIFPNGPGSGSFRSHVRHSRPPPADDLSRTPHGTYAAARYADDRRKSHRTTATTTDFEKGGLEAEETPVCIGRPYETRTVLIARPYQFDV